MKVCARLVFFSVLAVGGWSACSSDSETASPGDGGPAGPDSRVLDGPGDAAGRQEASTSDREAGASADAAPSTPETARVIAVGEAISGTVAAGYDSAHWFKYVPAQAFASVAASVATLEPQDGLGTIRWQTTTTLGLCNLSGGLVCCTGALVPADCKLTIQEGSSPTYTPVVAGKTYYVVVLGDAAGPTSYAFTLRENP